MSKRLIVGVAAVLLALGSNRLSGAERQWQHGVLRDLQIVTGAGTSVSIPIGGSAPTVVAGVPIGGSAPMYVSAPVNEEWQYVTIDGPNGLRYVARWHQKLGATIINDPIAFAVEDGFVYVKGDKNAESKKRLRLVSTTRLEPK